MPLWLRFALALGSVAFIRLAFENWRFPSRALILFAVGAAAGAVMYVLVERSRVAGRKPMAIAALSAALLLLMSTLPSLGQIDVTLVILQRVGLRVLYAWMYVCGAFFVLGRIWR